MSIIKRSVSNLARSLTAGMPLFKSKIELCVPQIVLTPSLADMQVYFRGSGNVAHLYSLIEMTNIVCYCDAAETQELSLS